MLYPPELQGRAIYEAVPGLLVPLAMRHNTGLCQDGVLIRAWPKTSVATLAETLGQP